MRLTRGELTFLQKLWRLKFVVNQETEAGNPQTVYRNIGLIQACLCNFQSRFIPFYSIFPGKLMHLQNSFLHGLSPPKSFIQKFQPDQKLWLFQNRVQVAPSTSCLPGSRGFSWDHSCFQGLYGQNSKAIRSIKAKQSAKTKVKLRFNLGLT